MPRRKQSSSPARKRRTHLSNLSFVVGLGALTTIISAFTVFGTNGVVHLLELREHERVLTDRAFLRLQENKALGNEIMLLNNDDRHLEALVRQRLGLVRKGEIVYRFSEPE